MSKRREKKLKKGIGAQIDPTNRFSKTEVVREHIEGIDFDVEEELRRTKFIDVHPKTIISKNTSPDVPFEQSINPYQGCEHGCVYCYARNSHEYWGYTAGRDFERIILVKREAAALLEKTFQKPSYSPKTIMLSGNTDCYQPVERKLGITRDLLEMMEKYRHPVALITKNSLILRDKDILSRLANKKLCRVAISLTTLNEELRRVLEPRTASVKQRLHTIRELSEAGISVHVNLAPIIPALNSDEVFDLVQAAAEAGATSVSYIAVRLNGQVAGIFEEWVRSAYPDRAGKVLMLIRETHDGKLNESNWNSRMTGEGVYANQLKQMFDLAVHRHFPQGFKKSPELTTDLFVRAPKGQMGLFN